MPWPGTAGGASSARWGDEIQLFITAGLGTGNPWTMGPHPYDRLDAGNVIGKVVAGAGINVPVQCDAIGVEIIDGAATNTGIFSKDEAATLTLTLYDPERVYDPLNAESPYFYRGRSRLGAGNPINVWAEVLNDAGTAVVHFDLFIGVTDSWQTEIDAIAADRRTKVIASGAVKWMVGQDYAELTTAIGAGDTTAQRLARIASYFGWQTAPVMRSPSASPTTLQATTMAQSMWELLNRTIDDELGYLHVTPDGIINWWSRTQWSAPPAAPSFVLGCMAGVTAYDVVIGSTMGASDDQLRNAVYAARTGGTQQIAKSTKSIADHGGYESTVNRTDLGIADDGQVAQWANAIVLLFSYPTSSLSSAVFEPGILALRGKDTRTLWRAALAMRVITDTVRVVWDDPGAGSTIDLTMRALGFRHSITPDSWELTYQLTAASFGGAANVWHIGPHALDKLDAGNVIGTAHSMALLELELEDGMVTA